jgi:hypothetical protein
LFDEPDDCPDEFSDGCDELPDELFDESAVMNPPGFLHDAQPVATMTVAVTHTRSDVRIRLPHSV